MQNAQTTEIQQRVINLVNTYRAKMREKHTTRNLSKREIESLEKQFEERFTDTKAYVGIDANKIEYYFFNEQLLGHFYAIVAGTDAEQDVLQQLLPDFYDTTIYTEEEETFLTEHFREMVNYIIHTPLNDWGEEERRDAPTKAHYLIPEEILTLIETHVEISHDAVIYNLFAGLGQFAVRFNRNRFLWSTDDVWLDETEKVCFDMIEKSWVNHQEEEKAWHKRTSCWLRSYAWARVAMFANNVKTHLVGNGDKFLEFNVLMAYIPYSSKEWGGEKMIQKMIQAYNHLKETGKMILLCPSRLLWDDSYTASLFRKQLVKDESIVEIIQLPSVMFSGLAESFCIIIAEKNRNQRFTTFIDARTASRDLSDKEIYSQSFDIVNFNKLLGNGGIDSESGLRKVVQIPSEQLSHEILIPQVYVVEKPLEAEQPVPLSSICTFASTSISEVQTDLPKDMPWISVSDLTTLYTGELNLASIKNAECFNYPTSNEVWEADISNMDSESIESILNTKGFIKWAIASNYRQSIYLNGNNDAVLCEYSAKYGAHIAVVRATGKPYAVRKEILVFCPKDCYDVYSLTAILRLPIVYRQLVAFQEFGIKNHLDDILIPTDKRVICDELYRMKREGEIIGELEKKLLNKEKSLRMRKHALTQYLSSIEAMFYALNSYREKHGVLNNEDVISRVKKTTVHEAFEFISQGLKDMMPALEHIAEVEYTFDKPEWIDPKKFIEDYIQKNEKGWLNFKPVVMGEHGHNQADEDLKEPVSGEISIRKGAPLNQFLFPKDALERVFKNIISNAKAHGFGDKSRNDYQIRFAWHTDGRSLTIEIDNNGSPIPNDRDTASLLEYGVSTKLHHDGHNGIGCNEIYDIMKRYDGKIEIVSLSGNEFPVKYILTFNNVRI